MTIRLVLGYSTAALVALLSALLFAPLLRAFATARGLVDVSDGHRKLHERAIPPIGGLTIGLSVGVAALVAWAAHTAPAARATPAIIKILMGALAMLVLGLADDLRPMRARYKLLGQAIIATAVCAWGFRVGPITVFGGPAVTLSVPVATVLTIVWLVGVTNAFNLIDGVDGLAPGAAVIGLTALSAIGARNQHELAAWVTCAIGAAALGFLRYNRYPASAFLGDAGSLLLGFMLASFAIFSGERPSGTLDAVVPITVLGLPILDTTIAVARRFLRGQPIFSPDRGHVHHRLLNRGHSPAETTLALCAVCGLLAIAGTILNAQPALAPVVLAVLGAAALWFVRHLRIDEFEELAESLARGAAQRQGISRSVRLREACVTLSTLPDMNASLHTLADTLCDIGIERGEIRLRDDFVRGVTLHGAQSTLVDETVVWCCGRPTAHDDAWQISFPLFTPDRERVGSLTLWQPARMRAESLGHWRVIGQQLCTAISPRLVALSRSAHPAAPMHVRPAGPAHRTHGAA
ncbi:MAG TPA: MraY family glycosyltransferase [Gemmatimonadaceae bacterium]|nr:MraY family glycosyltransferase [Gemmatimonadaceae bacterium]